MRDLTSNALAALLLASFTAAPALRAADGDLDATSGGGKVRVLWGNDAATATELEVLADGKLREGEKGEGASRLATSE